MTGFGESERLIHEGEAWLADRLVDPPTPDSVLILMRMEIERDESWLDACPEPAIPPAVAERTYRAMLHAANASPLHMTADHAPRHSDLQFHLPPPLSVQGGSAIGLSMDGGRTTVARRVLPKLRWIHRFAGIAAAVAICVHLGSLLSAPAAQPADEAFPLLLASLRGAPEEADMAMRLLDDDLRTLEQNLAARPLSAPSEDAMFESLRDDVDDLLNELEDDLDT